MYRFLIKAVSVGVMAFGLMLIAQQANAQAFGSRTVQSGSRGEDVREVQTRVSGWVNNCVGIGCSTHFLLDGVFGNLTVRAVKNFQKAEGITVDGIVGPQTFDRLRALAKPDGSSKYFNFAEFAEKSGECVTNNKGTFNGGPRSAGEVGEAVRKLMHRLEVVRAKRDHTNPIHVWSGFRSQAYNECLRRKHGSSVAKDSIHMYGGAWDGTMTNVTLGQQRGLAKTSQFQGIFCYANGDRHNHFDIRADIAKGGFVWPRTDSQGRDLSGGGSTCSGSYSSPPSTGTKTPAVGVAESPQSLLKIDPTAPTEAEGQANVVAPEEVWMREDD